MNNLSKNLDGGAVRVNKSKNKKNRHYQKI